MTLEFRPIQVGTFQLSVPNWTAGPEFVDHRVLHHLLVVEPVLLQGVAVPHLEEPGQNGPGQRRLRLHLQARVGGPAGRARDDRHDAGEAYGGGHVCLNHSGNSVTQHVYIRSPC